jgi:hypothetical protein
MAGAVAGIFETKSDYTKAQAEQAEAKRYRSESWIAANSVKHFSENLRRQKLDGSKM